MTLTARFRRLWLDVHLWIGAGLMVLILPISFSGAALVWHDAVDEILHPERFAVSQAPADKPLSAYLEAGRRAFAGRADVTGVRMPEEGGGPVLVNGRVEPAAEGARPGSLTAFIDPATLEVAAIADTRAGFTGVMHSLHGNLMIPGVGRKVVGWVGWAMLVSSLTGLWLWWPRNGAFLKALRWRRGASQLFNLHHMIGFWICVPLAVLSLTGVYISFPQTARAIFGTGAPASAEGKAPERKGADAKAKGPQGKGGGGNRFAPPLANPTTSIEAAAAAALALRPGDRLVSINLPTQGGGQPKWRVQVKSPGHAEPRTLEVADQTGEARVGPNNGGPESPNARWMRRIHDGNGMHPVWQWVVFLGGVAPVILSLTGLVMWLRRSARQRHLRRPEPSLQPAE